MERVDSAQQVLECRNDFIITLLLFFFILLIASITLPSVCVIFITLFVVLSIMRTVFFFKELESIIIDLQKDNDDLEMRLSKYDNSDCGF